MSYGSPFPPPPNEPPPSPAPTAGVHPITIGRAFGLSWSMLRYRWRALIGAAALLLVPIHLLNMVVQVNTAPVINAWAAAWNEWAMGATPLQPLPPPPDLPAGFAEALAVGLLAGSVTIVVSVLASAAVIHAAGRTYAGLDPSARDSATHALRRAPSLIGAQLLIFAAVLLILALGFGVAILLIAQGAGLLAFAGVLLLVVTFVVFFVLAIRWAFYQQAVMLEGTGAIAGLASSWRLVAGSGLRVLGYLIVLGLTIGLVTGVAVTAASQILTGGGPALDPGSVVVESVAMLLVTLAVTPYTTILLTLLYFDIRWAKGHSATGWSPPGRPGQPPYPGSPGS